MNENKYKELVEKLASYIDGVDTSVSPTPRADGGSAASVPLLLTRDMDIEALTESEIQLVHTLLHQFYARGGTKNLNKIDIEKLHDLVRKKINHRDFDRLDIK